MMASESNAIAVANVTMASLVKLVSLLSAEMVVGKYREDIDVLEAAIRRKLFATISRCIVGSDGGGRRSGAQAARPDVSRPAGARGGGD